MPQFSPNPEITFPTDYYASLYIGFPLIGSGCASVLNTQSSNEINESSEYSRYKY